MIPLVNSVLKDKNSSRYFGSVFWNSLPIQIRVDHSVLSFITKIKQWKPTVCPFTICKSYIGKVGYKKSMWMQKYLNHCLKTFDKTVKSFEKRWGSCFINFKCSSYYEVFYINSLFYDCFLIFVVYIWNVFIVWMVLWC